MATAMGSESTSAGSSPGVGGPAPQANVIAASSVAISVRVISAEEFRRRLPELVKIYVSAMRYPDGLLGPRVSLWTEHSHRAGFHAVVAEVLDGSACAIGYGYTGLPGQWWYTEVLRGMAHTATGWLMDFFELTELHVRPEQQGAGVGQSVLTRLLADRSEAAVLLSTPEGTNRAWRLYRRLGFADVLRNYRFSGDPRPFAVLGRTLPLSTT